MTTATETREAHPASDALARLLTALDDLQATSRIGFTRQESLEFTTDLYRAGARLDAAYLTSLAELDLLERGSVPGSRGKWLAATSLQQAAGLGRARAVRDLRTAQALRDQLPEVAAAYAAGETTRDHVDTARRVPQRVKRPTWREHGTTADAFLAEQARTLDVENFKRATGELLDTLDPSRVDGAEPRLEDRAFAFARADDGCGLARGTFLPDDAAMLQALFDAHAQVTPATEELDDDGLPYRVEDHRTKAQRQYDAIVAILRAGVATGDTDGPGLTPEVRVITGEEQLLEQPGAGRPEVDGWGDVPRRTAQQWLCTAILRRLRCTPDGGPLDVGRAHRNATPAQRAALHVRDRGCVIPGCTRPAKHCQAHHVRTWEDGGPTDLGNLALVCERHHREVHHGRWHIEIQDGIAWVTATDDPLKRRVRNLRHRNHPKRE